MERHSTEQHSTEQQARETRAMAADEADLAAVGRLPEFLYQQEADALYGKAVTGVPEIMTFEREMAELADKMILEVTALFDDDGIELDHSDESLEQLDKLITQVWEAEGGDEPIDDDALDAIVANWGAYLSMTIIQNLGGRFHFRQDLDHLSIHFSRTGLEVFPLHKVRKRFRLGPRESLFDFYEALVEELTEH